MLQAYWRWANDTFGNDLDEAAKWEKICEGGDSPCNYRLKEIFLKHNTGWLETTTAQRMFSRGIHLLLLTAKSGLAAAALIPNKLPKTLQTELDEAREAGVRPASPGEPAFGEALSGGTVKWAVLADGSLVVVPHTVGGNEIFHSVLSGGEPVQAAGQAEVAGSPETGYFGISISNHSGHFQPPPETLEIGIQAFAEVGITFGEEIPIG